MGSEQQVRGLLKLCHTGPLPGGACEPLQLGSPGLAHLLSAGLWGRSPGDLVLCPFPMPGEALTCP